MKCVNGRVGVLATCQIGSKFLQRIVQRQSEKFLSDEIVEEVLRESDRLMVD